MGESLGAYLENFAHYRDAIERLLDATDDLAALAAQASTVLADDDLLYASRYLTGPPASADDLRVLADVRLTPSSIRADPDAAGRVVETILRGLDPERFAWVRDKREPSTEERRIAVVATAALIASQRVRTGRATDAPRRQETLVKSRLSDAGFIEEGPRPIPNVFAAPDLGRFTGECIVGATRKADIVVRLWDGRVMPIECKVSNSELNSIKRLTNDALVSGVFGRAPGSTLLGRNNVVPVAVLSRRLRLAAPQRGAGPRPHPLFWAHSLDELLSFVAETRE